MYKIRNTGITIDINGAKQIADYLSVQEQETLPYAYMVPKKEFQKAQESARKLRAALEELGNSVQRFPREVKTKIKKCLAVIAKLISGQTRIEPIEDFLVQLCRPA